ncbi:MAG: EAL domain-containing protein [Eubacterium sp.]|nr:EAL domain-containing protein [Eubacterium sp.]
MKNYIDNNNLRRHVLIVDDEMIEIMRKDNDLKVIPIIVMTAEKDAEVRSIKLGAADFITKPYDTPEVILARCERIIEFQEDKTLISAAGKDNLTGLYTKDFFTEYIKQIEEYTPHDKSDLLVLNIEHFHLINELYGRAKGDTVLICIADALSQILDESYGIGCRADADYFYAFTENGSDYEKILLKLLECLSKGIPDAHIKLRMGVYPEVDKSLMVENWIDRAKTACDRIIGDYSRNIAYYTNEFYEKTKYQERLINDIDKAIKDRDLIVYYQPKYAIQGEKPTLRSAEALIRWNHPELGMISPGDFIPLFESNGLIQKLDRYVWREAARQISEWKNKYGLSVPVSVNVSRMDIYYPKLLDDFI